MYTQTKHGDVARTIPLPTTPPSQPSHSAHQTPLIRPAGSRGAAMSFSKGYSKKSDAKLCVHSFHSKKGCKFGDRCRNSHYNPKNPSR